MYEIVGDSTLAQCFIFTWFFMLGIGIVNFFALLFSAARIMDKLAKVLEKHDAEKSELKRALERRRGR